MVSSTVQNSHIFIFFNNTLNRNRRYIYIYIYIYYIKNTSVDMSYLRIKKKKKREKTTSFQFALISSLEGHRISEPTLQMKGQRVHCTIPSIQLHITYTLNREWKLERREKKNKKITIQKTTTSSPFD